MHCPIHTDDHTTKTWLGHTLARGQGPSNYQYLRLHLVAVSVTVRSPLLENGSSLYMFHPLFTDVS